ncbi:hypothetical protein FK513_31300 [Klebsiella pneumoniae]|nr:hypothetical protein [Klebsiella pneumoniae]
MINDEPVACSLWRIFSLVSRPFWWPMIISLSLVHQFMLAELETSRPFSGMARLTSNELVERFLLWPGAKRPAAT